MHEPEYVAGSVIRRTYGVCPDTIRGWADDQKVRSVRTTGGKHFYHTADVHQLMRRGGGGEGEVVKKEKIIYARVSSPAQRGDLQRQSDDLRSKYPTHVLVTDIASGINFQRRGLCPTEPRAQRRYLANYGCPQRQTLSFRVRPRTRRACAFGLQNRGSR